MQTPEKRWCLFSSESDALNTLYFPFGLVFIYLNRDLLLFASSSIQYSKEVINCLFGVSNCLMKFCKFCFLNLSVWAGFAITYFVLDYNL